MADFPPLSIDARRADIVRRIAAERVTVIEGETGCGKSSRVPLFLLEHSRRRGCVTSLLCSNEGRDVEGVCGASHRKARSKRRRFRPCLRRVRQICLCARAPVEEAYTALCTEKGSRRRCLGSLWTVLAVCTGMLHDGLSAAAQRAVALHRSAVQEVCFGPCWWCAVAGAIVRG